MLPVLSLPSVGCSRSSDKPVEMREGQARRETLELKLRCADIGRRFEDDLERSLRANGGILLASRFAYNAKLNTCILRVDSAMKGMASHSIIDLATNEELASYISDVGSGSSSEQASFNRREMELFEPKPDVSPKP